jgi:cytoskeletal protein CcmA (bactofilin family)
MKPIRKGCNDFKISTLGVAFCALMLATTENAVAISFTGAVDVLGCARNMTTYVCEDSAIPSAAGVSVAAGVAVIMLGSGVMKGGTIALLAGSAVQGDLEALTTVTMTDAQVTGNVTAGTTVTMTTSHVERNVWAGTTFTMNPYSHVGRNVSVGTTTILGVGAYVCQNIEGRATSTTALLGAGAYVNGNLTSMTTVTLGAGAYINGNVIAGTTATVGAGGYINGNVTAGTTVTFSGASICGTIDSVSQTPADPVMTVFNKNCPPIQPQTRCTSINSMGEGY